ncbi:N-acetyltransferase [Verrucosispora sp. NA02020]|uniref:N-acetyltransferase n=1 Tax=Verrucosispora sp. NA02020 TaxID=2742132 RepID=UPI0020CA76A5|nr:N-acetyltransferase [Verrucosispora sp. NA02020]
MPPTNPAVRPAHHGDSAALAALLAGQLHRQRLGAWLVPDPTARPTMLHSYARLIVAHALTHGRVDTTDDHTAVAIWHTRPETSTAGHDTLPLLPGGRHGRFALLHTYTATVHPGTPHHHLAHLAVRPDQHGQAAGHALLTHHHRHTDPQALGAYADVSTHRPRDHLLARAGYLPRTPILLAPGGPVLWRMWRPPHPARHPRSCAAELPRRVRLHRAATPFHSTVLTTATPRSP